MKRLLATLSIAVLAFMAAPADAQQRDRRGQPPEHARPMPPPGKQPAQDRRAEREQERGSDRLSPEERRKLREDINNHGREIYRDKDRRR